MKIILKNNGRATKSYSVIVENGNTTESRFSSMHQARKYKKNCFDYDTNKIEVIDLIVAPVKKEKLNHNWR